MRIGMRHLMAVAVAFPACGAPQPAEPIAAPSAPTVMTVTMPTAPVDPEPPVPEIVEPKPPERVGCTFAPGEGTLAHHLGFVVDGRPFAVIGGKVAIERIDVGEDGKVAFAVLDDGRVRLSARVAPQTLRFGQREGLSPLSGWLEVREGRIARASNGTAVLAVGLPYEFSAVSRPVVEVPCADLTPFRSGDPGWGGEQLDPGVRAPMTATPGGPVVGHLLGPTPRNPSPPDALEPVVVPNLTVLERRNGQARVRLVGPESAVVGWIDAKALEDKPASGLLGMLSRSGGGAGDRLACSRDVSLEVVSEGTRVRVGLLHANASVGYERLEDGRLVLVLRDVISQILSDSAFEAGEMPLHLEIAPEDLSACAPARE